MLSQQEFKQAQDRALDYFSKAGIVITDAEKERIEVADLGLSSLPQIGLEILTYVNTDRVCAKEIVLFPGQTCPEHRHPTRGNTPGKEETFRCRWGEVFLYVPGTPCKSPMTAGLDGFSDYMTVFHEVRLLPGEQYTLSPDTLHWFRAGAEGAVVSEFSTTSTDEADVFTDPRINRFTKLTEQEAN